MNFADSIGVELLNGFAGQSVLRDEILRLISDNPLFKGIPVMMLFWAAWMTRSVSRCRLVSAIVLTIAAIGIGRILPKALPFRPRPIHSDDPLINIPIDRPNIGFENLSAFPSDHAILFLTISLALILAHKGYGLVALGWSIIMICLPRVYLGLHWPTDILGGALVALIIVGVCARPLSRWLQSRGVEELTHTAAPIVFPILFLVTAEIATLFVYTRGFGSWLVNVF